ncbi:MAG TPA: hypothetical protein RMH26_02130, partial [Polyangiaceae bacterium LLY-WYZ-15_(1-7)]|nr:hypothetical protein [Polyangiaceae bacterium LLY-WYZ-15_(1-7)]
GAPSGDSVGAISQPALTHLAADGRVRTRPFQVGQAVLPLDLAASPDGRVAVVATGSRGFVKARVYDAPFARETIGLGEVTPVSFSDGRQALSVAFDAEGEAIVQTRAPWAVVTRFGPLTELPGVDRFDTGQALFHVDGGRGVACASCHPDGREDGHIWDFDLPGPRRTQTLRGGLRGSAPFHRDGAMRDFHELNRRTLGELMGAPTPFPDESEAMLRWLDTLPAVAPALQDDDAEAVARGRAVFEGAAGCADCHQGARLEDGERHHVGTDGPMDTPTLVGISRRLPWMADGCATSVDTFFADAVCRGERHGDFAGLRVEEERDLAAYLRSL